MFKFALFTNLINTLKWQIKLRKIQTIHSLCLACEQNLDNLKVVNKTTLRTRDILGAIRGHHLKLGDLNSGQIKQLILELKSLKKETSIR